MVKHKDQDSIYAIYTYKIWGIRLEFIRKMSHSTWGESEVGTPTIWGADWDYFSTANHVVITLNSSSCCILNILIITGVILTKSDSNGVKWAETPKFKNYSSS